MNGFCDLELTYQPLYELFVTSLSIIEKKLVIVMFKLKIWYERLIPETNVNADVTLTFDIVTSDSRVFVISFRHYIFFLLKLNICLKVKWQSNICHFIKICCVLDIWLVDQKWLRVPYQMRQTLFNFENS